MSIDTLAAAKALEMAGMANGQAEAVANVVRDATADLATKADLDALEGRLNEKLAAHQEKLDERLGAHEGRLDARLAAHQEKLDERLATHQEKQDVRLTAHQGLLDERLAAHDERLAAHQEKLDARLAAHQDMLDERLNALEARLMGAIHLQKAELMDALRQQVMTFLKTTLAAVGATAGVVSAIATIVVKLLG